MPEFYLGEIRMFPYGAVPNGWLPCDGQILSIHQNASLFALLGAVYGGDGDSTFALPKLMGGFVAGTGPAYYMGGYGGEAAHVLLPAEMPNHTHSTVAAPESNVSKLVASPKAGYPATPGEKIYALTANTTLSGGSNSKGGTAHNNMPPYVAVSFCIAIEGVFPDQP